jgi:hypothetical protein
MLLIATEHKDRRVDLQHINHFHNYQQVVETYEARV